MIGNCGSARMEMDCCSWGMQDRVNPPVRMPSRKAPSKRATVKSDEVPEVYRKGSNYQAVFAILYKNRERGITREKALKEIMKITHRPETLCHYDLNIVASPESCCQRRSDYGVNPPV